MNMNNLKGKSILFLTTILFLSLAASSYAQTEQKEGNKTKTDMNLQKTTKIKMAVEGMSCMGCVANVKNTIEAMEGVQEVEVSLEEKQAIVTYVISKIEPDKIQEAVNKKGFKAGKPVTEKINDEP